MNGVGALLQGWIEAVERLAVRIPELSLAAGRYSWPAAVAAAAVGIFLVVAGTKLGPLLSCAAGGVVGWLAGVQLCALAGRWHLPTTTITWASAAVLGVASLFAPVVYPLSLGAMVGTLVGLRLGIGGGGAAGGAVGALMLAGGAVLLRRLILAATAAVIGAALLVAALIALSVRFPALGALTHRPVLLVGVGALLAVAGTAFQFGVAQADAGRSPRDRRSRALARE